MNRDDLVRVVAQAFIRDAGDDPADCPAELEVASNDLAELAVKAIETVGVCLHKLPLALPGCECGVVAEASC